MNGSDAARRARPVSGQRLVGDHLVSDQRRVGDQRFVSGQRFVSDHQPVRHGHQLVRNERAGGGQRAVRCEDLTGGGRDE